MVSTPARPLVVRPASPASDTARRRPAKWLALVAVLLATAPAVGLTRDAATTIALATLAPEAETGPVVVFALPKPLSGDRPWSRAAQREPRPASSPPVGPRGSSGRTCSTARSSSIEPGWFTVEGLLDGASPAGDSQPERAAAARAVRTGTLGSTETSTTSHGAMDGAVRSGGRGAAEILARG
jgi:hypothetical protein